MESASKAEIMTNNNKVAVVQEDDESDSCFEFIKRRNLAISNNAAKFPELQNHELEKDVPKIVEVPKITTVKPSIVPVVVKTSPVKSVNVKSSPFKHRIDTIAENLKALQEQKKSTQPPKVAPVTTVATITKSKDTILDEKLKNIKLSPKELAHQLILLRCNKKIEFKPSQLIPVSDEKQKNSKMDEYEMNDDLTNLSWLTTFNLSKNIGPSSKNQTDLSPPNTPSSPISPVSTYNNSTIDEDASADFDDDESDSNHLTAQSINKNSAMWSFIYTLIKPWQQVDAKKGSLTNPSSVKVSQFAQRPPYSFSCLTFLAIESSQRKRLSVKEIYNWVTSNFPYYRSVPSGSWKNSIRHNLAMNQCFCKVDKNLLAMRDFSGKGSLWCINPELRPKLIKVLEKTRSNEFYHLIQLPYLQDINESVKQVAVNTVSPSPKLTKNRSASAINTAPLTIINPRLTQKLTFANNQKPASPRQSLISKIGNAKPVVISPVAVATVAKSEAKLKSSNSDLTELDAVKALLSMKSRASSMPAHGSGNENQSEQVIVKQGRRKQVFKPPMKKPHINPKILEQCSNTFYYNDEEDEDMDEEMDEDFEEDDDEELNNLSIDNEANAKSKKLLIKFPAHAATKSKQDVVTNEHIVTMSDDESDYLEENNLEIDESYDAEEKNRKEQLDQESDATASSKDVEKTNTIAMESDESNLEPGEVRKQSKINEKPLEIESKESLLELSKVANLLDSQKKHLNTEERLTLSKAKRQRVASDQPTRSTRSSNVVTKIETRTVTRSANKRKSK